MSHRAKVYAFFTVVIGLAIFLAGEASSASSQAVASAGFSALVWMTVSCVFTEIVNQYSPFDSSGKLVKSRDYVLWFSLTYLFFFTAGIIGAAWQIKGLL